MDLALCSLTFKNLQVIYRPVFCGLTENCDEGTALSTESLFLSPDSLLQIKDKKLVLNYKLK